MSRDVSPGNFGRKEKQGDGRSSKRGRWDYEYGYEKEGQRPG